jgi:hypothetical protein
MKYYKEYIRSRAKEIAVFSLLHESRSRFRSQKSPNRGGNEVWRAYFYLWRCPLQTNQEQNFSPIFCSIFRVLDVKTLKIGIGGARKKKGGG